MKKIVYAINFVLIVMIICFLSIGIVLFDGIFVLYKKGDLRLFFRTEVKEWNYNGENIECSCIKNGVAYGTDLSGKTAFIYNLSEEKCDVLLLNTNSFYYGKDINNSHFIDKDVEKAIWYSGLDRTEGMLYSGYTYFEILEKELIEYRDIPRSYLTVQERQFGSCLGHLDSTIVVMFIIDIPYFIIIRKKSLKNKSDLTS